jgi:hypothetical protein
MREGNWVDTTQETLSRAITNLAGLENATTYYEALKVKPR